jgi:hypothetical protein
MKLSRKVPFVFFCWLIIAVHALALVAILIFAARARLSAESPSAENNLAPSRAVSMPCDLDGRPVSPAPQGAQRAAPFSVKSSALNVKSSGACAPASSGAPEPASNPATAGSRVSSGPVSSVFFPVKQNGVPNLAPTLPAVAG